MSRRLGLSAGHARGAIEAIESGQSPFDCYRETTVGNPAGL